MEIKTFKQIVEEGKDNQQWQKKWVSVEDAKELIDKYFPEHNMKYVDSKKEKGVYCSVDYINKLKKELGDEE